MLHGLRTGIYRVDDLPAAVAWYTEVLGHGPYFEADTYVGFDVGGYELGLMPPEAGGAPGRGGTVVYWGVPDADAAVERLVALGAAPHEAVCDVGGGIRLGAVVDPFGNELGVIHNPQFAPGEAG